MKHIFQIIPALICLLCGNVQAAIKAQWSTEEAIAGERVILLILNESNVGEELVGIQSITNVESPSTDIDIAFKNAKYKKSVDKERFNTPEKYEHVRLRTAETGTQTEAHMLPVDIMTSGHVTCAPLQVTLSNGKTTTVQVPSLPVRKLRESSVSLPNGTKLLYMWIFDENTYCNGKAQRGILKLMLPPEVDDIGEPQCRNEQQQIHIHPYIGGQLASAIREKLPAEQYRKKGSKVYQIREYAIDFLPQVATPLNLSLPVYLGGNATAHNITLPALTLTEKSKASSLPIITDDIQKHHFSGLTVRNQDEQFRVSAQTDATELMHKKEINVHITITGPRYLEFIDSVPILNRNKLADKWEFGPPTKKLIHGADGCVKKVVITQPMTPISSVENGIPSFVLVYMNENYFAEQSSDPYTTIVTEPIMLPWASSATSLQNTPDQQPRKDSIYHFMPNQSSGGNGPATELPFCLWYLLYLPGCTILLWLSAEKIIRLRKAGNTRRALHKELQVIGNNQEGIAFLKELGAFIESKLPLSNKDEELQAILNKRDTEAFRPDSRTGISPTERSRMLKSVRKALKRLSLLLGACLLLHPTPAQATDTAMQYYEAGDYVKAREILLQELADGCRDRDKGELLYNIGNCQYHQGNKGEAALFYARALLETPGLKEAEANLATIQKEQHAIMPDSRTHDSVFTILSEPQLHLTTIICTAALLFFIALGLLLKGKFKPAVRTATGISLMLSLLCGINHIYYLTRAVPHITSTPPQELAYIISDCNALKSASNTADIAIKLPASTPVHILATRGSLRYVETFTGVRGWVPADTAVPLKEGTVTETTLHLKFK